MKNTFGQSVSVTLFGESHGPFVGAVLDGMAPGVPVDERFIAHQLELRAAYGALSTARHECDAEMFRLVSGVYEGKTTGTPLCVLIPNNNANSADYEALHAVARPGHADYAAWCKYHGFQDYRGGGNASGRLTAALVAVGAIAQSCLMRKGVQVGTHIARCAGISDAPFASDASELSHQIAELGKRRFAVLDQAAGERMRAEIEHAATAHDSVGGVLETAVAGLPAGVGEPWFDTLEGVLAHALFGIPAVKGVQFGAGFALADMRGSEANDAFRMEDDKPMTSTNNNGGINGGISNGMPVLFSCVIKPTPSIALKQQTVNFAEGMNVDVEITGRHDPAIVHRARVVVDSVASLVLCDMLAQRFGTDWLATSAHSAAADFACADPAAANPAGAHSACAGGE